MQAQNFVYVNNTTATTNTVVAFAADAGGVLTAVVGSPFPTGGTGAVAACPGIDRITVSPLGNHLFVSNAGNQTISSFQINPTTGVITPAPGSPFASGLTLDSCNGISLASTPDGAFLMASSNGTIKTFAVSSTGVLTAGASLSGLATPMVGMKISANGKFLASANPTSASVFSIAVDGSLTAVPGSPFARTGGNSLSALEFSCASDRLYSAEGGNAGLSVADAWSVAVNGALAPLGASPFSAAGGDSNSVLLTPDNTVLYQSNQGNNSINGFPVNVDGTLAAGVNTTAATTHLSGLASDNSGLFLFAADDTFGLAVYNIFPDGTVTLVGDNPIAGAGEIQGVAAYPPRSCAQADFAITQTASPNPVTAGNQITYTITITNKGPSTASVAINDVLPRASMTFVSCAVTSNGVCDKGAGLNRTITFANLASGQTGTATIVGATISTLLNQDTIVNTATVSNSSAFDPNPVDNTASTNVTVSAPLSATNFIVANSTGGYFGTTNLSTTLKRTLNGAAIAGRTITFSINGLAVGTATTNASGVATLSNVSLVQGGIPINAGTYVGALGVSFAGDSQFAASTGSSTLTVTKATLTVTTQPATRVYGDANPVFTYVISGFLNNETVGVVTGTASCTSSANVNTAAGTSTITCSIGTLAATNYNFVFVNSTLTITPAPLVLAGTDVSRLYGDANPAITGTVVGLKAGDKATATFSSTALSTSPVGSYPIIGVLVPQGGFNVSNYTITSSGNVTVAPAPLTAAATSVSRVYGDPNPSFAGTLTGLKNSDAITATFSAAADPTSPVGTYPITPTFTDPGTKISNYTVISTGTLTISPATLSVIANSATRLYGDPNPAFTGTVTGQRNGDAISATFSTTALITSPVGSYPIVATLVDPGNKAGNYTFTPASGTLTVSQAPLSIAAANATRVYGDANPAFTGTITGLKNADNITATYSSVADPTSAVGTYPINFTLVDPTSKAGNYAVVSSTGTLTVTQAPLSVTAASSTRLYGDPNPVFTGTIAGLKNSDNITATYASTATAGSGVGTFLITATLVDPTLKLTNYSVTITGGTLTVGPAPLTVTAANATRVYGDANPVFTGTISGVKNADAITATYASAATAGSPVGTASIVPTLSAVAGVLANYTVASNNGTLTITAAPLSISAADATRVYGDANPAFIGAVTGLKNADVITATFTTAATPASNVGAFPIVPTPVDAGGKIGNYAVTITNGTLTVTQAPLTVTAGNASRIYGDPNPAFTGTIVGLKNGDNITAVVSGTGASATSPVGTYPLVPALVDPNGKLANYSPTITNGTLTVTPAALSVSAANATRSYGDPNPVFSGTISGIKNADAITASYASAASATTGVGTATIVPTLAAPAGVLANYTVTSNNGVLTISPAALSVTAANASRLYGDANPVFTGVITGIKNNEAITAAFTSAATPGSSVGTSPIVPALSAAAGVLANYSVTSTNGVLTINPAALNVTAANATRLYGDPNPAFTGTITGIKNADNITATFASPAGLTTGVGSAAINATLVDPTAKLGNYTVTSTPGVLSITPALLTVTAGNANRIYGDPNPAFTGTILGLKNGDNITATVSGAGADPASPVGTYPLVPALVDPTGKLGNYNVTTNNGVLTVTAAPLTITASNASRAYGDVNPTFTALVSGLKNADVITATFSTTATQASPVGTFSIVPAAVDSVPPKLSNYTVNLVNGTLTVSPAALSITANPATRLYGDANPAFTGAIVGLKNGDLITATFSSAALATSPVGTATIVPAAVDSNPPKLGNYAVTLNNGTLTISPAPLTVTGTNASRLYGDPNPAFTGTVVGVKNGDNITATFSTLATAATGIGAQAITPTVVDPTAKLGNYAVTLNNGVLTINPAPLTVTAGSVSRLYGDPNPAFVGTITGLKNNDPITASVGGPAADPTTPIGTFTLIPALVDPQNKAANYTVTFNNGTLTISPAPLTVTANAATRLYGDANPAFTAIFAGLKNTDVFTATFATAATQASSIGAFTITPTAVDSNPSKLGNYTVTAINGTLTITPAPLANTAASATRLYGDANPVFTGNIVGIKNNDPITGSYASAATLTTPVGAVSIVPTTVGTAAVLANYSVTPVNGVLTISPAVLTVTAANATRVYGDPNPAFTGNVVGAKNGEIITATFSSAAGLGTSVGTASITSSVSAAAGVLANYTVTSVNGTLTITAAPLTVTAGSVSRLYGDPNPAFVGTITGLKNNDPITAIVGGPAADPTTPIGTFTLVPTLVDPQNKVGNYAVTSNNGTLTITQAPLTVTANTTTRLYGDPNPAFSATFTGLKNADVFTATFVTAATQASPVGSFTITPTPVDSTPSKLGNYAVTVANGSLTVTPAPLSITAANATRLYGDANPAFTGTVTGVKNADGITVAFTSLATPASAVGNVAITPTAVDPGSKLGNYTLALNNGTLAITQAPLTIAATPANRVYGDPNPAFTGTVTGIKNGDNITATFASAAGLTTPAGTASIVPTAVDPTAKLGNYNVTLTNATLTINAAPLTVTAGNVTRLYGDPNPPFNGTILGVKNGDNITAIVSGAGAAPGSPVGSYVLVPSLVDSVPPTLSNYAPVFTNGTLTITPAPLTIAGSNATRAYGDPNPAFNATFTGLKNGDSITATFASAAQTAGVGTYPIVATPVDPGAKLGNYSLTVTNGTLTVTPAPLSAVATSTSRLYGDANPVFTGTLTGVKNADVITAGFTSAALPANPIGTAAIVTTVNASAATLLNYTQSVQNGTLTINPAPLTVAGASDSRLYGDPNPIFSGTITGVKNLDNISASFGSTATVTSPVGGYPVVGTLVDPTGKLPNYTVINSNGTLTVNQASLTVAAANASRIYGDPNPVFTGTVIGLRNSDNITASFTSAAQTAAIGVYAITPVLADPTNKLGNYAVISNNGTLTVTAAALSVTTANASRAYGAANPAFTGTVTGIKNADNITATFASLANTASAVGTYPITPSLVDPASKLGNYTVISANGTLTVTQAKPAVALNVQAALPNSQLTAQVQSTGPALPTGTVQFFDGANALGSPVAVAPVAGVAQASLTFALTGGSHSITASYSGDATYLVSTSAAAVVTVAAPAFDLNGTGGNTSAAVTAGKDAVYNLTVANQGFAGSVAFSCAGAPAGTTCTVNPNPLPLTAAQSSAPIAVTISGTQNARLKPFGFKMPIFVVAGVFMGLASAFSSKKRRQVVFLTLAMLMIGGLAGCAGGSLKINDTGRAPTNAVITVTATSGSLSKTISLNLTINH